ARLHMTDEASANTPIALRSGIQTELSDHFQGGDIMDGNRGLEILFSSEAKVGQAPPKVFTLIQLVLGVQIAVGRGQLQLRFLPIQPQITVFVQEKLACTGEPMRQT